MKLKVKYLFPDLPELTTRDGDSGFDLRASIDNPVQIPPHHRAAAVQAATFEMRDQLTIVRSANHVLKEERKVLLSIIKACFPYVALHSTLEAEALQERIREALS